MRFPVNLVVVRVGKAYGALEHHTVVFAESHDVGSVPTIGSSITARAMHDVFVVYGDVPSVYRWLYHGFIADNLDTQNVGGFSVTVIRATQGGCGRKPFLCDLALPLGRQPFPSWRR